MIAMAPAPKITVVLTSFNHGQYLREAIDSVLAQTYTDFELLIWDDASIDDSWSIIASYTDTRIKAFRNDEQRRGAFGINKSIAEIGRADLIAIHHSDDAWEPDKLERQYAFLQAHPHIGAVFSNAQAIDENGAPLNDPEHFYTTIFQQPNRSRYEWLRHFFYRGNALCHPSVLMRKSCYRACGSYRLGLAQLTDFDMWIRLCMKFDIHVLPEKLVRFRVRANEANASGNRSDTRIRGTTELFILFSNYLNIPSFEEMVAVFPEAGRYYNSNGFVANFVLAMIALADETRPIAGAFAVALLFELVKQSPQAEKIKALYKFDYRNLVEITGKNDIFLAETTADLHRQLLAGNQRVIDLQTAAEEVSDWAKSLQNDLSARDNQILYLQSRLEELSEWGKTQHTTISTRDEQIRTLQALINEVSTWAQALNADLQQRNSDIQALNRQLQDNSTTNHDLQLEISTHNRKTLALRNNLKEFSRQTESLRAELGERDTEIANLKERVYELSSAHKMANAAALQREQQAVELKSRLDDLSNWAASLQATLHDRDEIIFNLYQRIDKASEEVRTSQSRTLERDQVIADLNQRIEQASFAYQAEIARAQGRAEAFNALNQRTEELLQHSRALENQIFARDARIDELQHVIEALSAHEHLLNADLRARDHVIAQQQDTLEYSQAVSNEKIDQQNVTIEEKTALAATYAERIAIAEERIACQQRDLMELSNWAARIDKHPLRHALRRMAGRTLRTLPVPVKSALGKIVSFSRRNKTRQRASDKDNVANRILGLSNRRDILSASIKGRNDIFIFSIIDWNFRIQRPQHIAQALAKHGNRVFFFSNHFVDTAEPGYSINQLDPELQLYEIKINVTGAPPIYFAPPSAVAEQMISSAISMLIADYGIAASISIVQHCYWFPIQCRIPDSYWIYDCMDHHEGFGDVPDSLIDIEKRLLARADLITVTSSWLQNFAGGYHRNVAIIRNGADFDHFAAQPEQIFVDAAKRKIIGYYGAIASWFDVELIEKIATAHSQALVLLIGADTIGASAALEHLANVRFIGEMPYKQLPFYLYAFDVCLLPFKVLPLTLATNPVKVYEYLAAGKPVVAVDLPEMAQFDGVVQTASDHDDFIARVTTVLNGAQQCSTAAQRQAFAAEQTWTHRAAQLFTCIEQLPLPKISVIVLTYNNLHLTQACIRSLLDHSNYPNLEIIVVDNASSDATPTYLQSLVEEHSDIKLVLNNENRGFAAGNNQGLEIASGDYLVILNNDTKVTPGWALTLLRHLQLDRTIGIIGPVTNNIGNEARIETCYTCPEEMLTEARQITLPKMGCLFSLRTVAFFCAMLPRHVYQKCGPLSEEFGLGFFEDDDYCRRIEALGYRVACADDVFVHHELSASFSKLSESTRQELFQANRAVYEAKWGSWIPHVYR